MPADFYTTVSIEQFMNMLKAVHKSKLLRQIIFHNHDFLISVSLAVICKGQRVPEAHHGAAQGERLRLRDL